MLFNSFIFILLFLPLSVSGYYLLHRFGRTAAQVFLVCMSLWFYGYFHPAYLLIILSSIVVNYLLSRSFSAGFSPGVKKAMFIAGILFNTGLLFYYKYFDFMLANINRLPNADFALRHVILPLGISFYTIQQLSYLIDTYRDPSARYSFLEYALFVSFFPQLVAGPIVYHTELIPQFRDPHNHVPDAGRLIKGIIWFILGLSKKVLIADVLGRGVDWGYGNIDLLSLSDAWLVALSFTLQLYFDFSGYSDMACGIACMFGIELPQNFNSPYRADSTVEFWKRWHMTLTRFLTKYIYIPLGGNRRGTFRTYVNVIITFLVSGIWHGADFTFFLWGFLNGCASVYDRLLDRQLKRIPQPVRWVFSFIFLNLMWSLFRAGGIGEWYQLLTRMFQTGSVALSGEFLLSFDTAFPVWILFAASLGICFGPDNNYVRRPAVNPFTVISSAALLTLCLLTFNRVSPFLYFNF